MTSEPVAYNRGDWIGPHDERRAIPRRDDMYLSGAWRGYWEQAIFGRQVMHDLILRFEGGRIDGEGYDCIGAFAFAGEYDEHGGVVMVKHYVGKHTVHYVGRYD